ncbi:MAG: hypothetical protein BMS9Abin09_1082 [Gammaproteobacteria bacterium]|nr:MAG: hypothetical protein BMS9Abin09_1082 [Gammaproteobacteria bacterium]
MKELFNNNVVQGVIVTLIGAFILWLVSYIRFKMDEKKIHKFLTASTANTEFTFRSEHRIASETNLSEERVHKVCSKSKKIARNQKEKKSWRLA